MKEHNAMRTRHKSVTLATLVATAAVCASTLVAPVGLASVAAAAEPDAPDASIVLGDPNEPNGLVQIEEGDGLTTPVTVGGKSARQLTNAGAKYLYLRIDDAIAYDGDYVACVRAEYYDEGKDGLTLQYDSRASAFAAAGTVTRADTKTWQTAEYNIVDGRFANRQNGGSDFRLAAGSGGATIHSVSLTIIEDDDGVTLPCSAGEAAPTTKWKVLHAEDFQADAVDTDQSEWVRYDYDRPFDTIMDDAGDWWKNDYGPEWEENVLNSFGTYRKNVQFGTDGWLTATLSARDTEGAGSPQEPPRISTTELSTGEKALRIDSPNSYDGAFVTTTEKLPPEYRLEYHLKTLDFGGERNGSIFYDGKENGYTPTEQCKTQFPYAEGIGTPGWNSDPTNPDPCAWQSVVDGPFGYNAFHLLGIVDFDNPEPANLHFWHYRRKILMDSFAQHPDRVGSGSGGRVCNPADNTSYDYRDSTANVIDMWFNGLPNFTPGKGGITGNSQWFSTTCTRGLPVPISPYAAAEMKPEIMPDSDYVFAVERSATGYTLEVTGDFLHAGHQTLRFYSPFIGGATPIWHYNNTPEQYDGRYNRALVQNGVHGQQQWADQWPDDSAYPDFPIIGDPYTDAGEGSATIDSIRLLVPGEDTTKPETTLVSPTAEGPFTGLNLQVDATDLDGLARVVANVYQDGKLVKSTQTAGNGATRVSHTATVDLPEGTYRVRYNSQDLAGNVSTTREQTVVIDKTAPTATVKTGPGETVGADGSYSKVSFKLFDAGKVDKVVLNGVEKNLSDNAWSDLNFVRPGVFGAVLGTNTLVVYDVAGNTSTTEFTLTP
ncbi:hypothetical protein [Agromyces larvae]|uniref:Uncharacterized protein n=1 Tax=Agromyces larvae TaxID=2929802 RepID=A0ABY4C0P8_9MICO|nr:hypothetical protein [Agromyces larvae]UOE45066.1 hypothetical protein MTO99_04610 [Agromyces larvae]